MNDQLMAFLVNTLESMETDSLFDVAEDALNRIKSNQEINEYVQYQAKIIETIFEEIQARC